MGKDDKGDDKPLTRKEILNWQNIYKDANSLQSFMKAKVAKDHEQFLDALSTLGSVRHDASAFQSHSGRLFKWKVSYESEEESGCVGFRISESAAKAQQEHRTGIKLIFPVGFAYKLQLAAKGRFWRDYLYITNSKYATGELGLFTAREFNKYSIIGFYCGKDVSPSGPSEIGASNNVTKEKEEEDAVDETVGIYIRDNDARMRCLQATSLTKLSKMSDDGKTPLFMGMHYANDPFVCFRLGDGHELFNAGNKVNAILQEDGSIMAIKKLRKDDEILICYRTENVEGNLRATYEKLHERHLKIMADYGKSNRPPAVVTNKAGSKKPTTSKKKTTVKHKKSSSVH